METYDTEPSETKDDIIKELNSRLESVVEENSRLKILLDTYAIDINEGKYISNEEIICKNEIDRLMNMSTTSGLEAEDIKNLEILTKVRDRINNGNKKKAVKKGNKVELGKLLKIASED